MITLYDSWSLHIGQTSGAFLPTTIWPNLRHCHIISPSRENTNNVQNSIIDDFTDYAQIKYIEDKNLTEYRIAVNLLDSIPEKLQNHTKSISEVESYYRGLSFSCTKQKYW